MSSVDQSYSMLKSYEENIGEAFQLTIKTNTNNDDGGNNNTATNNDNDDNNNTDNSTTFLTNIIE